jgi:hypothetical protein
VEVFIRGLYPEPLVERDVVSLYPSAARLQPLPHEKTKWVHVTTVDEVHTLEGLRIGRTGALLGVAGGFLPARQYAPACQRQAGPGAAVPLRGAWRAGAGAVVPSGGRPHRLPDEAPTAGRHYTPLLYTPLLKEAGGVRAILEHLGLPPAGARRAPARGPPQAAWC